ncbi:MAG TPA: hypothetical protein PLG94_13675 [Smithellaceae bacterium]|nr:hypothetical protein [Smithellaceae bacterium]
MLDLNINSDVTPVETDYDPMEDFYFHQIFPESVVEFFMASKFSFPEQLLTLLSNESGLSGKVIWSIANNIRNQDYADLMKELITMIVDRLDLSDRMDILGDTFSEKIDKLIIHSKHNDQVKKIADASYALVEKIFEDNGKTLRSYKSIKKCQVKKVVVYILVAIMMVYLRHNQEQKFAS